MAKHRNATLVSRVVATIVIVVGGCLLAWHLMVPTSYPVSEKAQTTTTTKITTPFLGIGTHTIPAQTTVTINHYYLVGRVKQRLWARVKIANKEYFVPAKRLTLIQTNHINGLIASWQYPHRLVKSSIDHQFTRQSFHTVFNRPRGVVVHDTGTEHTTVASESGYMERNYANTGIFVHTFISARQILNIANVHYMAQGAGPNANPYFVQFEMPHEYTRKGFAMQLANAAYYTASVLRENHLPVVKGKANGSGTVWTHAMVSDYLGGTDHQDPNAYWQTSAADLFASSYQINDFINLVQAYYNRL